MPQIPPPQPTAQIAVLHDARAVHDCSRVALSQFIVNGRPVWMIIDIVPGDRSGSATIPGGHIRAETGQLVTPTGGQTVAVKEGRWRVLGSAGQADSPGGQYSWTEPILEKRTLTPEEHYSPFIHGGRILSSHVVGTTGIGQFGPVVLLPDENFDRFVAGAFLIAQQNPSLLTNGGLTREAVAPLTALLHQDNDLVAAQTFRILFEAGQLSPDTVNEVVSEAHGYRLSMFIYVLLTARTLDGDLSARIAIGAANRRDPDSLRMVALAALSAAQFGPPATVKADNSLLSALREQFEDARVPRGRDTYLDSVFEMLGVSQ